MKDLVELLHSQQIIAIVGVIVGLLIAIFVLRLQYFEKELDSLQSNANALSNEIKNELTIDIKKRNPDVEVVINKVNSLSAVDSMRKRLGSFGRSNKRGFYSDFISIGILVFIAVMSLTDIEVYTLIGFSFVTGLFVFVNIYLFISNSREFAKLKIKLKEKTFPS